MQKILLSLSLLFSSVYLLPSNATAESPSDLNAVRKTLVQELLVHYSGDVLKIQTIGNHAEYAVLAAAAYADNMADPNAALAQAEQLGWAVIDDPTAYGGSDAPRRIKRKARLGGDTVAFVFKKESEIVVAFRGSAVAADWITNGQIVLPRLPAPQIANAAEIALDMEQWLQSKRQKTGEYVSLKFVGHSLGGRMAQVARLAATDHHETFVFNSSPLGEYDDDNWRNKDRPKSDWSLKAYRSPQDWLQIGRALLPENQAVADSTKVENLVPASLPKSIFAGDVRTWAEYVHSITHMSNAMLDAKFSTEQGWLGTYLASAECKLPNRAGSFSVSCPKFLRNAPLHLIEKTECVYGACQNGTRWRSTEAGTYYQNLPAPDQQGEVMGEFQPGEWVEILDVTVVGERRLTELANGELIFAYYAWDSGCMQVWEFGSKVSCEANHILLSAPFATNHWARVVSETGWTGYVDLYPAWDVEANLITQAATEIRNLYEENPDVSRSQVKRLLDEWENRGIRFSSYSSKHGLTLSEAISHAQDIALAEELRDRGWRGCVANSLLQYGGLQNKDLAIVKSGLAMDRGWACDGPDLFRKAIFGIAKDDFDIDASVAYLALLIEDGKDPGSFLYSLQSNHMRNLPNAMLLRQRVLALQ